MKSQKAKKLKSLCMELLCITTGLSGPLLSARHGKSSNDSTLGLFTVNIFRPFSAHFQSHFSIIFMNLAEKLTEWTEKCDKK
jgi:hypothetical protein